MARRRLGAVFAVALSGLGVVVPAPVASAATVDTNASYVLVNRNSGKVLDVYGRATNDGARISQYTRNDGAWQQWQFVDSGGGYYRLRSREPIRGRRARAPPPRRGPPGRPPVRLLSACGLA